MKYENPLIEHDTNGSLKKLIIGICDNELCKKEIDNSKDSYIMSQKGLLYHIKCYKGD